MNPEITTLDTATRTIDTKTIFAKDGFTCSLLTLAPGDEVPPRAASQVEQHLLFVLDGAITVRFGPTNTILNKEEALLVPQGREHSIAAQPESWARILRVEVPPRQIVTPQILTI